jgi:hypothetical protein
MEMLKKKKQRNNEIEKQKEIKPIKVTKLEDYSDNEEEVKGPKYTLSIVIPSSVVDNAQVILF